MSGVPVLSQNLNTGFPVLDEYLRRERVKGTIGSENSFQLRPINFQTIKDSSEAILNVREILTGIQLKSQNRIDWGILPLMSSSEFNTNRPYGWGNKGLTPGVGFQTYLSTGFYASVGFLEVQFQPEFTFSENRSYQGYERNSRRSINRDRFFYWNDGDNPELFPGNETRFWWGQSRVQVNVGGFALVASTENIWWGPGQFNSLIFSDNAEGFPHLSLQTNRPVKTFMGNFEGQIIMGRLENSFIEPSQDPSLNEQFFQEFDDDWRYLNGITITYSPVFLPNLFVGFNRTFQQYNESKGNEFSDWFPIFEFFQKERFFENGNTVIFDSEGQDQQVSVNFRYVVPKALFEIYADYGRRDHAFNWREFILNPEHARAYQFGFQKLFKAGRPTQFIQLRGEITHQQESVNRYIRYRGLDGNQTWHTHSLARGFVNYGQTLGVGTGVGSNVQTLEVSLVENFDKMGLLFERLENHQDFFYRAYGQNNEKRPWVDLSLGLLFDKKWDRFLLSSRAQFIYSQNYQYNSEGLSTGDFPNGQKLLSFFGRLNLIYTLASK